MAELTKSPHEFGLEVTLLPGYPNVYQNPGGPIEVPDSLRDNMTKQFFLSIQLESFPTGNSGARSSDQLYASAEKCEGGGEGGQ